MALKSPSVKVLPKENPSIIAWCDKILKTSMYVLVFLLPLFFGPWSYQVGDLNKLALLVILSFLGLAAWVAKTLFSGKLILRLSPIHITMGALVVVCGLSTFFSAARYGSFWGAGQVFAPSFVCVASLAVIYFLVSNTFLRKDIAASIQVLGFSFALTLVYGILQISGLHLVPLAFAQNNSFNTIGSLGSFGFFAAALMPLWAMLSVAAKKWWKALYLGNIVLAFLAVLLINYYFLWIVLSVAALAVMVLWVIRRDIFDARWMFLPIFVLLVSLFFAFFSPSVPWLPHNPLEVSLSGKANLEIDLRALKSLELFGAGPGNFGHQFAKYKNQDFNQSPLWNVNFTSGSSKALTAFAETGILGFIALLASMALPLFYGVKYLLAQRTKEDAITPLVLALLAVVVTQTMGYFLYNANITLDFIWFFSVASLVALLFGSSKEYALKSSSLVTTAATFMFVLAFIFYAVVIIMGGQRYVADMQYHRGLDLYRQDKKDESLQYLKKAAQIGNSDMYFNQLALFSLARIQDYAFGFATANQDMAKQAVQSLVLGAINASNASVTLNPKNYENWSTRAYVCQNLMGLTAAAPECALQSYDSALALNPSSPYLILQEGNIYVSQAVAEKDNAKKNELLTKAVDKFNAAIALKQNYALAYLQLSVALGLEQKDGESSVALQNAEMYSAGDAGLLLQIGVVYYQAKNWPKAQDNFLRALVLVPKYANALYFSGLTYEKQGQREKALAQFSRILELNTNKEYIQKIVNNIKAGKPALEGLSQQTPEPVAPPAEAPTANK